MVKGVQTLKGSSFPKKEENISCVNAILFPRTAVWALKTRSVSNLGRSTMQIVLSLPTQHRHKADIHLRVFDDRLQ
jgi:hypothetical protein